MRARELEGYEGAGALAWRVEERRFGCVRRLHSAVYHGKVTFQSRPSSVPLGPLGGERERRAQCVGCNGGAP